MAQVSGKLCMPFSTFKKKLAILSETGKSQHDYIKAKTSPQTACHDQVWLCCPVAERTAVGVAHHIRLPAVHE